ncbi:MAG: hypothetical protein AAF489_11355 [Bacteroidota bacterium]
MYKSRFHLLLFSILAILLFTTLISCNEENSKKNTYVVYNQKQYRNIQKRDAAAKIEVIDTSCINQSKRAETDLVLGKLIFYCDSLDYGYSEKQLMLYHLGIELHHLAIPFCGYGRLPEFDTNCYERTMVIEVYKRFGEKYIDSILIDAEKRFALKNPDSVFIRDGEDLRFRYLD